MKPLPESDQRILDKLVECFAHSEPNDTTNLFWLGRKCLSEEEIEQANHNLFYFVYFFKELKDRGIRYRMGKGDSGPTGLPQHIMMFWRLPDKPVKKEKTAPSQKQEGLTIKQRIIKVLKTSPKLTQSEISSSIDDGAHDPATIHEALRSLMGKGWVVRTEESPYRYSLSEKEEQEFEAYLAPKKAKTKPSNICVPKPSKEEVEKWLAHWRGLESYVHQETAIDRLFREVFPGNDDLENVMIKCSVLNDFYSTKIFKIYPLAVHIRDLHIDERLQRGDLSLVEDIADVHMSNSEETHFYYSFASKYCSHHNPGTYPIYDSFVKKMLKFFRDEYHFDEFLDSELMNYPRFREILLNFRSFFGLELYTLKELDVYLWQLGKDTFKGDQKPKKPLE